MAEAEYRGSAPAGAGQRSAPVARGPQDTGEVGAVGSGVEASGGITVGAGGRARCPTYVGQPERRKADPSLFPRIKRCARTSSGWLFCNARSKMRWTEHLSGG